MSLFGFKATAVTTYTSCSIYIEKCFVRSQLNISLRFVLSLNPLTFSDAIVKAIGILLGSFVDKYLYDLVTKLHHPH